MNRMKQCRRFTSVACLLSLPSIGACSSAGLVDDDSYAEINTPNALIFEAKWSDTGRFQILNDESGHMGMAVTGTIGKDDPRDVGKLIERSFVDTYRNLLPHESVPPLLTNLDARRLDARRSVLASPDLVPSATGDPVDTVAPAEQESFADFRNLVGDRDFQHSCSVHRAMSYTFILLTGYVENGPICPGNNDWSFFWNMSSANGSHALSAISGTGYVAPANSWGYHVWGTNYPCAKVHLWNSVEGELGVTSHIYQAQPCAREDVSE